MDTIANTYALVEDGIVTADGGRILQIRGSQALTLWKYDAEGTPIWHKRFGVEISTIGNSTALLAAADGGFFIMQEVARTTNSGGWNEDSMRFTVRVARMDVNGVAIWERSFRGIVRSYGETGEGLVGKFKGSIDQAGNLFVLLKEEHGINIGDVCMVFKCSIDGALEWARQVGVSYSGGIVWGMVAVTPSALQIVPDGAGGCYIASDNTDPIPNSSIIVHMGSDGSFLWQRRIKYTNALNEWTLNDAALAPNGDLLTTGEVNSFGGYAYVQAISPSGDITSSHFYSTTGQYPNYERIAITDMGNLLLKQERVVSRLDLATGDVLSSCSWNSGIVDQNKCRLGAAIIQEEDNDAVVFGDLVYTDTVFGYHQYVPAFWRLDPDAGNEGCTMQSYAMSHIIVPDSLFMTYIDTNVLSVPINMHAGDTLTPIQDLPLLGTYGTCSIFTGIEQVEPPACLISVTNSCASRGEGIMLRPNADVLLRLLESDGRVISEAHLLHAGLPFTLDTSDLSSGVYVVQAHAMIDERASVVRIVVQ